MGKKIILSAISLVLIYNTYVLLTIFFELPPERFSSLAITASSIAFNLLITGAVAFLGFVYPTNRILKKDYYEIKNPKRLKLLYKWLGVKFFRFFLLKTFYRKKNNKKYFNGTKKGILDFDYNTRQSEFGHLIALLIIFTVSLVLLVLGHKNVFLLMQPINILLNLYPILLQRKHRINIQRLIKRIDGKQD